MKKLVYLEGVGGYEVTEKTLAPKTGLKGKDVIFIAQLFDLSYSEKSRYAIKAKDGFIYMHILSDYSAIGSEYAEASAITALRGYLKSSIDKAVRGAIYVDANLYYLFVVDDKDNLLTMRKIYKDRDTIGETVRSVISEGYPVTILTFLNEFDGSMHDIEAMEQSLGMSIVTPSTGGYTFEDLVFTGVLETQLLPVIGGKITKEGNVVMGEDTDVVPSVLKGLAIFAIALIIGSVFHIMAIPYAKVGIPQQATTQIDQATLDNYTKMLNDYAEFIESQQTKPVSPVIDKVIQSLIQNELEPISLDISKSSVVAHVRTRDLDKALNFRKQFEGQCTDITKNGPYFEFSFTVEVK